LRRCRPAASPPRRLRHGCSAGWPSGPRCQNTRVHGGLTWPSSSPVWVSRFYMCFTRQRLLSRACEDFFHYSFNQKFAVFGITGSSSMLLVRPVIKPIVGEGSMIDGPWRYRILSILMVTPVCVIIVTRWLYMQGCIQRLSPCAPWPNHLILSNPLFRYSLILMAVGTAAGRHHYFKKVVLRMWGRFLPAAWLQRFS
jgi:hypothetical protein